MAAILEAGLLNALATTFLAIGVALVALARPRPALLHVLWVLVLGRLLLPPTLGWTVPVSLFSVERSQTVNVALPVASGSSGPAATEGSSTATLESAPDAQQVRFPATAPDALDADALPRSPAVPGSSTRLPVGTAPEIHRHATPSGSQLTSEPSGSAQRIRAGGMGFSQVGMLVNSLCVLWVVGSVVCLLVTIVRVAQFSWTLRRAEPAGEELLTEARRIAESLGLARLPRIVVVDGSVAPAVWPIGRLTILLPRQLIDSLDAAETATLLAHELIHIRRRDHWVRFLELAATACFWWLPTLWWARLRLHRAEEAVCDAWLARIWPERVPDYARGFVAAAELLVRPRLVLPASGLSNLQQLQQRLTKLFGAPPPHRLSRPLAALIILVAAIALTCGPVAGPAADSPAQPPAKEATAAAPDFRQHIQSSDGQPLGLDNLPTSIDTHHKLLSPDGRRVAFTGSFLTADGERHGLFVVELATGEIRRLSDRSIKMGVGWSPDSTRIAAGLAGGYVVGYPLAIIDVDSGAIDQTGILGHDPVWSPDGTEIACLTDRHRADGVPDGRIGIWNIARRELRHVSPPGHTISLERTGDSFTSGAYGLTWSPDSRRLAFQQHIRERRDKQDRPKCIQLWAVNRNGTDLRLLSADWPQKQYLRSPIWSADGLRITTEDGTLTFQVTHGTPVAEAGWPEPPEDFQQELQREQEALKRAQQYDTQHVLQRNRAWQNPQFDGLSNVQFLHRMSPVRLDERFSWRRDGACSVDVVFREDEQAASEIGRLWALTPDNVQLTLPVGGHYPTRTQRRAEDARDERLGHLMGTRINVVALDWGRHPERYKVIDARPAEAAGQTVLTIRPDYRHPDFRENRRRFPVNFGAMFHTMSWAYLHDLPAGWTDLRIEDATGRILQESATVEKASRNIRFQEWLDLADGTSVPRHITVEVPGHQFHAEYHFHVPVKSLWILKSGKSWFDGQEPQHEEIVDLHWNADEPDVDRHLQKLQDGLQELDRPADEQQLTSHPAAPLELGATVPLRWMGPRDSLCEVIESLKFTIHRAKTTESTWASRPTLSLDLNLSRPLPRMQTTGPMSIVLYDDNGRPVESYSAPIAAVESLQRSAAPFLERIRAHSRLWIDPDLKALPNVTYRFHFGAKNQITNKSESEHSLQDAENPHAARGITMRTGLDEMLKSPERYRLPLLFEADFNGRKVDVAVVTGPAYGWVFGNGIEHSWRGYTSGGNWLTVLVVDRETGCPLLERYQHGEVHFLDYSEPQPGQYVPRRIVNRNNSSSKFDFRFQVLNGRVWLFHQSVTEKGETSVFVDDIRIAGQSPQTVDQLDEVSTVDLKDFDWASVTNRNVAAEATAFDRELASFTDPTASPQYALLGQVEPVGDRQIRLNLGRSFLNKFATRWSLSRTTELGTVVATVDGPVQQAVSTPGVPVAIDRTDIVNLSSGPDDETQIHSVKLQRTETGEWTATLEIVSQARYSELQTVATGVLLNEQGEPIAAAQQQATYRVRDSVYSSRETVLNFGSLPAGIRPARLLLGIRTQQVGGLMGSTWARYSTSDPVFPFERLLASAERDVWVSGLHELYDEYSRDIVRQNKPRGNHRRHALANAFSPFRPHFERLFDQGRDVEGLGLLCRLAGHSGDTSYVPQLVVLLKHNDPSVQDAAAVGLGLLNDRRAIDRIRELATSVSESESRSPSIVNDARSALDVLGESMP